MIGVLHDCNGNGDGTREWETGIWKREWDTGMGNGNGNWKELGKLTFLTISERFAA